jgi:hypothetical protein
MQVLQEVMGDVMKLREAAIADKMDNVLPRWRGEMRRRILLLPSVERLPRMSMMELDDLKVEVDSIWATAKRYNAKRIEDLRCQ